MLQTKKIQLQPGEIGNVGGRLFVNCSNCGKIVPWRFWRGFRHICR